jgi:aryl-alcohol dehydrogenase-like predicted oxidoreductase/adenylate kinase family enzyme
MRGPAWLDASAIRIGLGCMRLSTDADADEERAARTIDAAAAAGITVFDTARAYGDSEALLGRVLRGSPARIVTKGGMRRDWVPDGRAKAIRADCEASLQALDGLAIDLYLLHAPDPRTRWATSVRALARLVDEGLVRRVGVANVNRPQLDEALGLAPITAVQVALSPFDDRARRGGVLERCEQLGLTLIAHSPLGGPRRRGAAARNDVLREIAAARGATPEEVALAWLLDLSPVVVPIPGARRPETARSVARAAALELEAADRTRLAGAFGQARTARTHRAERADVVLVMGLPGAGKSRIAAGYEERGYVRLNRDERGGSLRELGEALDDLLARGARRVVLDNTYLTRAARSYSVEAAARHHIEPRCVWLDTPLAQAQVNLVERLLDRVGSLPEPEELKALAREPGLLLPTSQMRAVRELEPPSGDEGFAAVERVEFERQSGSGKAGVFVAAAAVDDWAPTGGDAPHLVFDWRTGPVEAEVARLAASVSGLVEGAICPHGGGAPTCWCRPPLPGLILAFARRHGVDPARSTLVGPSAAHRTLATTLGAAYVGAGLTGNQ